MLLPELKDTYQDLLSAASNADLLIAGELVYAAPLVAEKLSLRWVSLILSPFSFFSSHDPSVMVNAPNLIHLRRFGASAYRMGLYFGRLVTRHWSKPVRALRCAEGLGPKCDPVFRDKFSSNLVLALFSRCLAQPQRDWPKQTVQPGFLFFEDNNRATNLPPELINFLEGGEPPIVFTQGSTAVHNPGHFYEISVAAAKRLQRRAILIGASSVPPMNAPDILTVQYAAYSQVFPRAAVNVHQGGSGTTGEALRSGRPMLIVPYGWDQPDNASRVQRLGAGLHIGRKNYTVANAAEALGKLLQMPSFSDCAAEVRTRMVAENGLTTACNAIESVMPGPA
jgi:UDP:flavonoid glycosyltransferase YjiC (YdhE family)